MALTGTGKTAQVARSALATELNRRVAEKQPTTWPEVVSLGVGVTRAVLEEEPFKDHRSWVRGCEHELSTYGQVVSRASAHDPNRTKGRGPNKLDMQLNTC